MASSMEAVDGEKDFVVEMTSAEPDEVPRSEQTRPLLMDASSPKLNIFSSSYPRRTHREQTIRIAELDKSSFSNFVLWLWGGSRYSGILCMTLSSTIYFLMEGVSNIFSVQSIPLIETVLTRCLIVLILSYIWLRSSQSLFIPPNALKWLVLRALMGCLSLFSFVYTIERLPLSQAIILNFTTPIMASLTAGIILHENPKILDMAGLACSFFGVICIFRPFLTRQGDSELMRGGNEDHEGSHHFSTALGGLFSSACGGINYCLIRAGAKASDQPVATVLSFSMMATLSSLILCGFTFQDFVLPRFHSFVVMIILGILAFFAEVLFARGLHLERTSRVSNIIHIQVVLSELWKLVVFSYKGGVPLGNIVGSLLVFISVSSSFFLGPTDKPTI